MFNNSINQQTFKTYRLARAVLRGMAIGHMRIYQINPLYQDFGWVQEIMNMRVKQNVSFTVL